MRRSLTILIAAGAILSTGLHAQSLGDVARQQQQKKAQKAAAGAENAGKKVITNEDLPQSSSGTESPKVIPKSEPSSRTGPSSSAISAEQWKARIKGQKDRIASLQEHIDKLQASVHYVEANRYSNGPEYNQAQLRKQQEVDQMKPSLEEEKAKLKELQEEARQAGFGSAVYD